MGYWAQVLDVAKTIDIMSQLSKDGTVVYPSEDNVDNRILAAKYKIYRDMANTQRQYRREIDEALSENS